MAGRDPGGVRVGHLLEKAPARRPKRSLATKRRSASRANDAESPTLGNMPHELECGGGMRASTVIERRHHESITRSARVMRHHVHQDH